MTLILTLVCLLGLFLSSEFRGAHCAHSVFRPSLVQRLTRLEKRLKIPPERRHVCEARQQKATEVYVEGIRIRHRAGSMLLDQAGRVVNTGTDKSTTLLWSNRRETTPMKASYAEVRPYSWPLEYIYLSAKIVRASGQAREERKIHLERARRRRSHSRDLRFAALREPRL